MGALAYNPDATGQRNQVHTPPPGQLDLPTALRSAHKKHLARTVLMHVLYLHSSIVNQVSGGTPKQKYKKIYMHTMFIFEWQIWGIECYCHLFMFTKALEFKHTSNN